MKITEIKGEADFNKYRNGKNLAHVHNEVLGYLLMKANTTCPCKEDEPKKPQHNKKVVMAVKKGWGGRRKGAGRKSKAEELGLSGTLDEIIDNAAVIKALKAKIEKGDIRAIQIYMEYYYGKPTKEVNMNTNIEVDHIDSVKDMLKHSYKESYDEESDR